MAKKCSQCRKVLDLEEFHRTKKTRDGRQYHCKGCHRRYFKKRYKNPKYRKHLTHLKSERKKMLVGYALDHLKTHPCVDCGEDDPLVLEFDHVRGKKSGNIGYMMAAQCRLEDLISEIKKCDVRCANCHRRKTAKKSGSIRSILLAPVVK